MIETEIFHHSWNANSMTQKLQLPQLPHPDHHAYQDYVLMHVAHGQHLKADEERAKLGILDQKESDQVKSMVEIMALKRSLLDMEPSKSQLNEVKERYAYIEREEDYDEFIKSRLNFGSGIQIVSDLDKTMSTTDQYQNHIISSVAAENYMAHPANDEPSFIIAVVRYWGHAIKHTPNELRRTGQNIELRAGVKEFFATVKSKNYPAIISSRNFKPVVQGVVDQFPEHTFETFYSIDHDDISAMDKATVVRNRVLVHPDHSLIFIGDGTSDLPTLSEEARGVIGCYFALEGSSFAKKLKDENLPHYVYRDFNDISAILKRLSIF